MIRTLLLVVVAILGVSSSSFAWGMLFSHPSLSGWALMPVANPVLAGEIALNASGPDWARETGGCSKAPCGADAYGHRISEYLLDKVGHRELSRYGKLGAELGAWQFAEQARSAYRAGNGDWKKYLGWATHYLADALCPPHCCSSPCDTWTTGSPEREALFEGFFEVSNSGALSSFMSSIQVMLPGTTVTFYTGPGIRDWVANTARRVAGLPLQSRTIPPYLSASNLTKVFQWIGAGIRGLYVYVTG